MDSDDGMFDKTPVYIEDEIDMTYDSDVEFEEDKDLMITLGRSQGLWEKFEEKYEQSQKSEGGKEELSVKEKVAEGRQIFDTKTAYKLLSKELISIIK